MLPRSRARPFRACSRHATIFTHATTIPRAGLSTLTHRKNGAVRDMLFEDKGCTFISVFGALKYNEQTELRAVLCAMEMAKGLKKEGLADFTIGVSVGPCFCGVAGPHFRRDYVVIGPEVNLVGFIGNRSHERATTRTWSLTPFVSLFLRHASSLTQLAAFHSVLPGRAANRQSRKRDVPREQEHRRRDDGGYRVRADGRDRGQGKARILPRLSAQGA